MPAGQGQEDEGRSSEVQLGVTHGWLGSTKAPGSPGPGHTPWPGLWVFLGTARPAIWCQPLPLPGHPAPKIYLEALGLSSPTWGWVAPTALLDRVRARLPFSVLRCLCLTEQLPAEHLLPASLGVHAAGVYPAGSCGLHVLSGRGPGCSSPGVRHLIP